MMYTSDGRLAILDWSLVARPPKAALETMAQCFVAALSFDARRLASAIAELAERGQPDVPALRAAASHWLAQVRRGALPGLAWFIGLLDDVTQNAGLRVSPELMLIRKALLTLEGVLAELGSNSDEMDIVLLTELLIQSAGEWPWRWWSAPDSREFATRLSNVDLLCLAATWPMATARWAIGAFG
jgi:predicted unusual protein kinase regulating ubiquinone biosynthesis (AarF/ABC1/UbiB family)